VLLDEASMSRVIRRLAHEVHERHRSPDGMVLAGVRTRGVPIAERLSVLLRDLTGVTPVVAALDLRSFRDDLPLREPSPSAALSATSSGAPQSVDGRVVVVVDDVLHTGRSLRAALDALSHQGRAALVEALVLVDRGHRELPLRATYVGKNVPTAADQRVVVRLRECDGVDGAWLVADS